MTRSRKPLFVLPASPLASSSDALGLRLVLEDDRRDADLLGLDVLGEVRVVVRLHLGVGDGVRGDLRVELVAHQLLDHHLLHRADDFGILVEAAAIRFLREHLEADERVEELLLLLERRVARADVRRLPVDALLELAERDRDVVDLRERRLQLFGALRRRVRRAPRRGCAGVARTGSSLLLAAHAAGRAAATTRTRAHARLRCSRSTSESVQQGSSGRCGRAARRAGGAIANRPSGKLAEPDRDQRLQRARSSGRRDRRPACSRSRARARRAGGRSP